MNELTIVDFHGTSLIAQKGESPTTTLVAMRPIVEGMGLDWSAQYRKIRRNAVLRKGIAVMATPSARGPQDALALPLSRLNFWLATVDADRIKNADTRARVIEYQEECADVLFAHFFRQGRQDVIQGQPEPKENEAAKVRMVTEARHTFGTRASGQLWMELNLPVVPAMFENPAQGDFFRRPGLYVVE